ncbi:MAG: HAD hydrolase-like protein [bacterium]|nr:HAD hydrolase-like protein [bacterium]
MTASCNHPPGVIFDLDGTLADTLEDITDAANEVLSAAGLPLQPPDRIRAFVGDGVEQLMERAGDTNDSDMLARLVGGFRASYDQNYLRRTCLYPGLAPALTALARAGCPMAVLSNKPDDFTRAICDALLGEWKLVAVAGTSDHWPNKPDPTKAGLLADQMDRSPADVVFVGDSDTDIQTAQAGGMRSLAVSWGFRDRDVLLQARPDRIIDRPDELPGAILG